MERLRLRVNIQHVARIILCLRPRGSRISSDSNIGGRIPLNRKVPIIRAIVSLYAHNATHQSFTRCFEINRRCAFITDYFVFERNFFLNNNIEKESRSMTIIDRRKLGDCYQSFLNLKILKKNWKWKLCSKTVPFNYFQVDFNEIFGA